MIKVTTRDHRQAHIRPLTFNDFDRLTHYLQRLSPESKRRFGPHPFDRDSVEAYHRLHPDVTGFIALHEEVEVVAYALIKQGLIAEDIPRLTGYGLRPDAQTDCTYAPSVADEWQSCGLGTLLFELIREDCRQKGFQRIILWGGVQSTNTKAVNYYNKLGFIHLGTFEHNGPNDDMMLLL